MPMDIKRGECVASKAQPIEYENVQRSMSWFRGAHDNVDQSGPVPTGVANAGISATIGLRDGRGIARKEPHLGAVGKPAK